MDKPTVDSTQVEQCVATLKLLAEQGDVLAQLTDEERAAVMKAAGQLVYAGPIERQRRRKAMEKIRRQKRKETDRAIRDGANIRTARLDPVFSAPKEKALPIGEPLPTLGTLHAPRTCYVCLQKFSEVHHFYDTMCPACGDFNYAKRFQRADLTDQVALITGSRLKIGYHTTLMMLRSGARVIATTRFPADSAYRYAQEEDFADWGDRLHIYGLDLRHLPSVELFTEYVGTRYGRLDILINNAAQTVRRPAGFFRHLMEREQLGFAKHPERVRQLLGDHQNCLDGVGNQEANAKLAVGWGVNDSALGIRASAALSQIPYQIDHSLKEVEVFPEGALDADLQQVDLRTSNSWRLRIGEIETTEMVEVQLVNSVAPFILCNRLTEMMRRDYTGQKHIVNVSAMEGKFHRTNKIDRHPHTNMAKAALNMLTHTSASDLAKDGIFMNAVDTGWVTDEDPAHLAEEKTDVHGFQPPLDIVDGAARVCDPIIDGINTGNHVYGQFLKDYRSIDW